MPVNITKSYKVTTLDPTVFTNINSALINVEISSLTNQTFSANPSNSNELEPIYPIDTVEDSVFGDNGASVNWAFSSLTNQTFSANPSNSNELEPIYPIDTVEDSVFGDNGASVDVALSD